MSLNVFNKFAYIPIPGLIWKFYLKFYLKMHANARDKRSLNFASEVFALLTDKVLLFSKMACYINNTQSQIKYRK